MDDLMGGWSDILRGLGKLMVSSVVYGQMSVYMDSFIGA